MDAEITRLTYVQRYAGSKLWGGLPGAVDSGALHGALPKHEAVRQLGNGANVRLEARIVELESERVEMQRKHREELAAAHQEATETLTSALGEQREMLARDYAAKLAAVLAAFQEEETRYFRAAESAVVRLALEIAKRVLYREVQLDPLMLRGAVRVALEEAQQGKRCVLEVAYSEAEAWRQWLSAEALGGSVEIRGREDVAPGHCRVEIGPSTADVSVHAQLAEIERGFFDLLQSRPGTTTQREQGA
jgi:flagellar assembly protein FliH